MSYEKFIGLSINNYKILNYINSGSFGNVYEVIHKKTKELFALKIPIISEEKDGQKMIIDESKIYKYLSDPSKGIPNVKLISYDKKRIMVMDLLGPSLDSLFHQQKKRFSLQTIIKLTISMIQILQYIHSKGFIHRDLKPDNFTLDKDNKKLFCIDFGLAKRYIHKSGEHIKFSKSRRFCGTAKYASIAAHEHLEQSRKDDLESLVYVLVYLYKGKLPWSDIKHSDKKKRYKKIYKEKMKYTPEELCNNMPREYTIFLNYIRTMDFQEKPPYSSFIKMFTKLYHKNNFTHDLYDWEIKK